MITRPTMSAEPHLRESPWGPIPVYDAHVHFFSRRFFTLLAAQKDQLTAESAIQQLGWQMPPEDPKDLARIWASELDRHHVSGSVLIASIPGDEVSVRTAAEDLPHRFFPFAMVNPRRLMLEALEGLSAVCLFPAMHGFSMGEDCVTPVLEWAKRRGRAVFVHCGVLSVGVRKRLGLPSPFDMRFSNPVDLHAVALRYPEVPFIVPHFGAGYFREALMLVDLCPNVYLDTSSSNQWMRYEPGHLNLRQIFQRALDVAGPTRLLFGTDSSFFPRGWQHPVFEEQATALYEIGVSPANAQAIFGGNLLRVLGRAEN